MKWNVKPYPKQGDKITVKKFALLPKRLDSNIVIWFEYYYEDRKYIGRDCGTPSYWLTLWRYQIRGAN